MSVTFAQRGRPPPNPAQIQKVKKLTVASQKRKKNIYIHGRHVFSLVTTSKHEIHIIRILSSITMYVYVVVMFF